MAAVLDWAGSDDEPVPSAHAMEETLNDMAMFREFARLGDGILRAPDETAILRFFNLVDRYDFATGMLRVVGDIKVDR